MAFHIFLEEMNKHLKRFLQEGTLFFVDVEKDVLWDTYLDSFPPGTNEVYRERREYDCSTCKNFVRNFGGVVYIDKDLQIQTIWDFTPSHPTFQPVVKALAKLVRTAKIKDFFYTKEPSYGASSTPETLEDGNVRNWRHFYVSIPSQYICGKSGSVESLQAGKRDTKCVLKRSLDELTQESIRTVLELISQNSLYKGEEWGSTLSKFEALSDKYHGLPEKKRDNFTWLQAETAGMVLGRIRNHSIGVLLQDISAGENLDQAVTKYERIVAPTNYKRPKAIFTKKMIEEAQKTIESLGLLDSLPRRHATLDDITINNILFANRDAVKRMSKDIFEDLQKDVAQNLKSFDKVEEVGIEEFIQKILPKITNLEVLLENKHASNLVSLIAPMNTGSATMFKWSNNFSWAYEGNITDSMKERVKAFGGDVSGELRFSIQWNEKGDNEDDLDAHCDEPKGNHIYFGNKGRRHDSTGMLDVDIVRPKEQTKDGVAVENICWLSRQKMPKGVYQLYVHCYNSRGNSKSGFSAEVEFDGQVHSFHYAKALRQGEKIPVAKVTLTEDNEFKIKPYLDSSVSSKEIWNLKTQQFQPVSILMFSPNYWDAQSGIGNKHYFFMLKNCLNENSPNGFFNEFLKEDLLKHKRVFEALGGKMAVKRSEDQLSGLGFSSTQRNQIICKVSGSFTRTLKINF